MSLFQALMQLANKTINQPYIIEISTAENCSNYNKAIKQTLKYLTKYTLLRIIHH